MLGAISPGPYIAHLESQYSWAQIRLAAYSQGSRPSAQVPEVVQGYLLESREQSYTGGQAPTSRIATSRV